MLTKDCPHCGANNGELALECGSCGIVFERYGRHSLKRPGRKKAGIAVLLVALAAVLVVVVVARPTPEPGQDLVEEPTLDSDVAEVASDVQEPDAAPPDIAGIQITLIPVSDGDLHRVRVQMSAIDNKVRPATFDGDVTLSWGLQAPDQHNEVLETGPWIDERVTLHEIPIDPGTMRGSVLVVEARARGLVSEASLEL
ncbi:MAG: hypothetical protein GY913_22855 [Proteobacteria bacterium]|nr:hypothetical protein [Pseudomonadota bacterium]MCP4919751.1 hypothetical protein [Pseudomonadota bacterium]